MEKRDGTQTLQFAYDYLNRRVRKTVRSGGPSATITSSTKFVWAGWQLTAELNAGTAEAQSGTTFLRSYLWGLDFSNGSGAAGGAGALLGVYQGGAWYHTAYDAMGNLTGYLNTSGTAVASYDGARQREDGHAEWRAPALAEAGSDRHRFGGRTRQYNAFGQIIASGGSATSFAFGFATQYTDRESDLVYYGMRYYQPKHGRFINRDPIEEAGGLNLYSFTGNSPSNRWDVLGLLTECGMELVGHETTCNWISTGIVDIDGYKSIGALVCAPDYNRPIYKFRCRDVPDSPTTDETGGGADGNNPGGGSGGGGGGGSSGSPPPGGTPPTTGPDNPEKGKVPIRQRWDAYNRCRENVFKSQYGTLGELAEDFGYLTIPALGVSLLVDEGLELFGDAVERHATDLAVRGPRPPLPGEVPATAAERRAARTAASRMIVGRVILQSVAKLTGVVSALATGFQLGMHTEALSECGYIWDPSWTPEQ